jgi:hypothetical protein
VVMSSMEPSFCALLDARIAPHRFALAARLVLLLMPIQLYVHPALLAVIPAIQLILLVVPAVSMAPISAEPAVFSVTLPVLHAVVLLIHVSAVKLASSTLLERVSVCYVREIAALVLMLILVPSVTRDSL